MAIGAQVLTVPICLKYWGKEAYGAWLALFAAFMLLRSLETGFVAFVGNKINYLYHEDPKAMRAHLGSSPFGLLVIAALELVVASGAVLSGEVSRLLGLADRAHGILETGMALLVLVIAWVGSGSFTGILHRLLIPAGLMYQCAWWLMAIQVGQFAAIIVSAFFGLSILQTSCVYAGAQGVIYLSSAVYVRNRLPAYYPWWSEGAPRIGIGDLRESMLLTASNLIQQGATNGVTLLVSILSGPANVPVFTTVRTLSNLWTTVTNLLTSPLHPELVRYHASGQHQKLLIGCQAYWVLVGTLVNAGVLLCFPMIQSLYMLWTGKLIQLDRALMSWLLVAVLLANLAGYITFYQGIMNRLGILLGTAAARAISALVVGSHLAGTWGIAGFGFGIMLGEFFATLLQLRSFFVQELLPHGIRVPALSVTYATAGTALPIVFLIQSAAGAPFQGSVFSLCLIGTLAAGFLGWKELDQELRHRVLALIGFGQSRGA